ncbi:type II secretion system protein [Deinococcus aquaedulcis]|uniref:type II secretion system protein n=1 Tax=Deinococcus aquaedulcis TaxID=2840455 RepID=UPI001C831E5B|nr:type II secretion system protein [Deinococcus aquaedulcis]
MKNTTQGFTLIELLIVIAIIGILAAVLIPNLLGAQKRGYDTGASSCAKSIQTAQATYQIDKQTYFPISKAADATSYTFGNDGSNNAVTEANVDGLAANCKDANMIIDTATAPANGGNATYTITVKDRRGKNTYTITPSTLTAGAS